jgi:uncharacterized protein YbjT (DUF2867 family)
VKQLSARGIEVVALVRDANRAADKLPVSKHVHTVEGDLYQYNTLPQALTGCDAIICAASFRNILDPLGPFKVDFSVCSCQPCMGEIFCLNLIFALS